jgi:CPA2 family monovalent cation:H+ antiporter-2
MQEIFRYTDAVRHDHYDTRLNTEDEHRLLHDLLDAANSIEIHWFRLGERNPLVGQTLANANLRSKTGASVVALLRQGHLTANPKSMTLFEPGDRIGVIGEKDEIEAVEKLLSGPASESVDVGVEWET